MPATLTKKARKTQRHPVLTKTTPAGLIITGPVHQPQAGNGACKKCSCQKFVPENRFMLVQGEAHQFIACANCGHDIRQHA